MHLTDLAALRAGPVVVTEKMDGEVCVLHADRVHARSPDGRAHPWQSWVRALHACVRAGIAPGWRVVGENLYARHSIAYTRLDDWFLGFAVVDDRDRFLDWDATRAALARLGLACVPVRYEGAWRDDLPGRLWHPTHPGTGDGVEGVVVRTRRGFPAERFALHVAKWVRADHVRTGRDWSRGPVVVNGRVDHARP